MKRRNKIFITIVSGIILASGLAACNHHSPEEKADYMVEKITSKLELSTPQVSQLEQLKNEVLGLRKSMLAERDAVHSEIDELFSQATLDQSRTLGLVRNRTESINQKAPQLVTAFAGFYDSLSPEQQAKLREKVKEHKERSHHWHH